MNIYLIIAIILANLTSIAIVYQFIKKLEKKQIITLIAISIAIMYICISITFWFSGFGIEKQVHEASKNFVLYIFVPVNVILFIPYFGAQYIKLKENKIKIEALAKKVSTLIILLLITLTVEFFYFRNIQLNINEMQNVLQSQEENKKDEQINTETENIQNEIQEQMQNVEN